MLTRRALLLNSAALAAAGPGCSKHGAAAPTVLKLQSRTIEVNGKAASVYGLRQRDGVSGIVANVGERFRVRVENEIDEPSLIH
jgi:hypothetical protein